MKDDMVEAWVAGQLALTLLAIDPVGLGGLHLRARSGPVRQAFLDQMPDALNPITRIAPTLDDTTLFGGTDLAATLATGRVIRTRGVLAQDTTLMLTMAERCPPALGARLSQALDAGRTSPILLLDEGIDDERPPAALVERLAFSLDLEGLNLDSMTEMALERGAIGSAQSRIADVELPHDAADALTRTALQFGILTMRAPLFAASAARAHAALCRRDRVTETDLQIAATLVYAPRATMLPDDQDEHETPDQKPQGNEDTQPVEGAEIPDEMLVEAVRASLPPGVLNRRNAERARAASGAGQGAKKRSSRRGRPLPARPGLPGQNARIDLFATLRAAAPWQTLRRQAMPDRTGIIVRKSDIHVRRYEERSERLVLFCVDASGSAAMARLGEAKGAVELMLADAYSKRDRVAMIAFRGNGAELVLPPTRSLVQAKRRLAGLPGGGGTPLAAGLQTAHTLILRAIQQGQAPALALLTDGRANVPLSGEGRGAAMDDARRVAMLIAATGAGGAVIDTGQRPRSELRELADLMRLDYLALPRADAASVKTGLDTALGR